MNQQPIQNPSALKYKAAAITFVVINGISVIQGIFVLFLAFGMPTSSLGIPVQDMVVQKSLWSLYAVSYLVTSAYALVIGCLVLAQRASGFWLSGAIVSIVAGLIGMIMLMFHLPASIWLIIVIKRIRQSRRSG